MSGIAGDLRTVVVLKNFLTIVPELENGVQKRWEFSTSHQMTGPNPQAVGADHCQAGSSKMLYKIVEGVV
jgi:hypothetical protein